MHLFLLQHMKEDISNNVGNQTMYGLKIHCNRNLVTKILQSIFFHILQEKESHAGLEQHENEFMTELKFFGDLTIRVISPPLVSPKE